MKKLITVLAVLALFVSLTAIGVSADTGTPDVLTLEETESGYSIDPAEHPDGLVITGAASGAVLTVVGNGDINITLNNMTAKQLVVNDATSGAARTVRLTLVGENYLYNELFVDASILKTADSDIVIDGDGSLTARSAGFFFTSDGKDGTLTVNGGTVTCSSSNVSANAPLIKGDYTQNGGTVTLSTIDNTGCAGTVTLNGGILSVSNNSPQLFTLMKSVTLGSGAALKLVNSTGIILHPSVEVLVADSAGENAFPFARSSADGGFVPIYSIRNIAVERYLELKLDIHSHGNWVNGICICGKICEHIGGEANCSTFAVCEICGNSYGDYDETKHNLVVENGFAPSCTEAGLTDEEHCLLCTYSVPEETIPATGHTVAIDVAVPPSFNSSGLTEGSHCQVCGEVLEAQQEIPKRSPAVWIISAVIAVAVIAGVVVFATARKKKAE